MKSVFLMLIFATLAVTSHAEPGPTVTPELQPDAAVIATIQGLGDGASANLPKAKITGDINDVARKYGLDKKGPGGRNYCIKMMWMPERKRAIFCGANHGVPHRLNDVWEYDLAANTWVCLYAPDLSKGTKSAGWTDTIVTNGVLRTKRGGPAIIGHQWWQLDYDPELKAMMFISGWTMAPKEVKKDLYPKNKHKPPLWAFYPEEKKWDPIMPQGKTPRTGIAVYFQYLPPLKKLAYVDAGYRMGGMWLYSSTSNTWKQVHGGESFKAKNNPGTIAGDGVMVYAPDRNLLIGCSRLRKGGGRTVHYDIQQDKWLPAVEGEASPGGHDSFTPCGYDTVGKVMLLYDQKSKIFWGYDPGTQQWSKITPKGPPPMKGNSKVIGYYDPARNVFVLCQANSVWVYRHAKRQ